MKVLDLQCSAGHIFEGWFGSERDFEMQVERGLMLCPLCGDPEVQKKLSAPRLNLSGAKAPVDSPAASAAEATTIPDLKPELLNALHHAWVTMAKQVLAQTEDVGDAFAHEARRIHYGEVKERGIRGNATPTEARELMEEGIDLVALPIPEHLKNPLQ
nr:DUF1178 family protein [uncultured Rhodoferax sp.]